MPKTISNYKKFSNSLAKSSVKPKFKLSSKSTIGPVAGPCDALEN